MRTCRDRWLHATTAVALLTTTVSAHHSFKAEFDATQPVTLKGTVRRVEWVNPHAWIYLDVEAPDGTVTTWAIEGSTPGALMRKTVRKADLPPGAVITVQGYRARSGEPKANGRELTLPDGRHVAIE
jgi:hypothetical protein